MACPIDPTIINPSVSYTRIGDDCRKIARCLPKQNILDPARPQSYPDTCLG